MDYFDRLPEPIRDALVALALSTIAAVGVALRQWIQARFYKGAFSNAVEAIHAEGCASCAAKAKELNLADGIERKVAPVVTRIKASEDAKES